MNGRLWVTALAVGLAAAPGYAVDHNNVDASAPLSFDDAESIAFRERAIERGLLLRSPRGRPLGLQSHLELLYGFALNSHVNIGLTPAIGGRADSARTSFDIGDVSVGAFHSFNREYNGTPAFAMRADLSLPTGRDSNVLGFRLRGIMSKTAGGHRRAGGGHGRLHVNVDLNARPSAERGERQFQPGLIVGYSRPVGYPRRFNQTAVAELGIQAGERSGAGPVILAGIGLRRQVTVRSILDLGVEAGVAGFDGAARDRIRLVAGYSTSF